MPFDEATRLQAVAMVAAGATLGYLCATMDWKKTCQKACLDRRVRVAVEANRLLGEGPVWDCENQHLLWVDKVRAKIFVFDPKTKTNREVDVRQTVGTLVPVSGRPNQVLAALMRGVAIVDISEKDGSVIKWLGNPEEEAFMFGNCFNDGKCDPAGRLWAGTMDLFGKEGTGALYCVDIDGSISQKIFPASIPNGIVWSSDGKLMYWIDTTSMPLRVDAFDFDPVTGNATNRRCAVKMSDRGFPDGCAIDSQDRIWVAKWGGWCVECYDPKNKSNAPVQTIEFPVEQVTACAFGGPRLDQLFVTTASCGLSKEAKQAQPLAGSLFVVDLSGQVKGVPSVPYKYKGGE